MDDRVTKVRKLCREIRRLREMPTATEIDREAWEEEATRIWLKIQADSDLCLSAPHFLWHYLDDLRVRLDDPFIARSQEEGIEETLAAMERGDLSEEDYTLASVAAPNSEAGSGAAPQGAMITKAIVELAALVFGGTGGMLFVHLVAELALTPLGPEAAMAKPIGGSGNLTPLMLVSAIVGFPAGFALSRGVLFWVGRH